MSKNNQASVEASRVEQEFAVRAAGDFCSFVDRGDFPCLGAKAALNGESFVLRIYDELAADTSTKELAEDLGAFVAPGWRARSEYSSFIAIFRSPLGEEEAQFDNTPAGRQVITGNLHSRPRTKIETGNAGRALSFCILSHLMHGMK
jgi:FPC/CPF motif-containing protein YcgG